MRRPGAQRGPRTPSRTADANLDSAFVENALLFAALKIGRARVPPLTPLATFLEPIFHPFSWTVPVVGAAYHGRTKLGRALSPA